MFTKYDSVETIQRRDQQKEEACKELGEEINRGVWVIE